MPTMLIFHEVENIDHWLKSPKRDQFFGPHGYTVRTFVDPTDAHRVGVLLEGPDLDTFEQMMQTDAAADAMRHDGVRPDTVRVLVER